MRAAVFWLRHCPQDTFLLPANPPTASEYHAKSHVPGTSNDDAIYSTRKERKTMQRASPVLIIPVPTTSIASHRRGPHSKGCTSFAVVFSVLFSQFTFFFHSHNITALDCFISGRTFLTTSPLLHSKTGASNTGKGTANKLSPFN